MTSGETFWRGCLLLTLWEPGIARALLEVSGKVGRGVELPCGESGALRGQRNMTWTRLQHNRTRLLASLATGDREELDGRLGLVHDGILHLLIHNLTQADSGDYTCLDSNGKKYPSHLRVSGHPAWPVRSGEGFYLNCTGEAVADKPNDVPKLTLSRCLGDDIWIPCGESNADPFRWEDRRAAAADGNGSSVVIRRVWLHQGYGLALIGRPSMVILRLRYRDAGVYSCRTNGTSYRVRLAVVGPGILEFLTKWWVPLVTVICLLCLYGLVLGTVLRLRNRRKRKAHNKRISRIMRSFFHNKNVSEFQVDGSYSRRFSDSGQDGTAEREGSHSTCYENLASHEPQGGRRGAGGSPPRMDPHVEAAQSYENVSVNQDQISDDYLEPDQDGRSDKGSDGGSDGGSCASEDYLEPDGDLTPKLEIRAHIHSPLGSETEDQKLRRLYAVPERKEDGGCSESCDEDYAVPDVDCPGVLEMSRLRSRSDASEIYEEMEGQHKQFSENDYEKMEESHYANTRERGESLEEEYMRMERSLHGKV